MMRTFDHCALRRAMISRGPRMKRWPWIGVVSTLGLSLAWWLMSSDRAVEAHSAQRPSTDGASRHGPRKAARHARLRDELSELRRAASGHNLAAALLERLLALAESDPEGAVMLAAMLSDAEGREEALHECLPHFLRADPDGAQEWLVGEAQTLPFAIVRSLARDVAALDPRLALEMVDHLPVGERASSFGDVFTAWAARDPAEAARVGEELPSPRDRAAALDAVGALWAEDDGQAAFDWANRYEAPGSRRVALESVVDAWARREPEAAALSLAALRPGDVFRQRLLDRVAAGWAAADVEEALAWAQSLPNSLEREATATTILMELAATQPERAAEQAARLSDGKMSPLVDKVMTLWAARDRQSAARFSRSHGIVTARE